MQKVLSMEGRAQSRGLIRDNVFGNSSYGIATGGVPFATFGVTLQNNIVPGIQASFYPAGSFGNAVGADTLRVKQLTAGVVR